MESEAYQELIARLNRIEGYIERTTNLFQDMDDELEMTTKNVIETLSVSESTLYRWRKKQFLRYRFTTCGDVRYSYKSLVFSLKSRRLRIPGMTDHEALGRLNRFKDNLIINSCLDVQQRK